MTPRSTEGAGLGLLIYPSSMATTLVRPHVPEATGLHNAPPKYDFMIRGILAANATEVALDVESLTIDVKAESRTVERVTYAGGSLRFAATQAQLEQMRGPLLPFVFGGEPPPEINRFRCSTTLAPKESTGILFEHFVIASATPPTRCAVEVSYRTGGERQAQRATLELARPSQQNRLRFPVAGPCVVLNSFDNVDLVSHRRLQSQEFALDIAQVLPGLDYHPLDARNESYACYGEPVLAVADGTVIEAHDGYPENPRGGRFLTSGEIAQLSSEHPAFAHLAGNWVLVGHAGGEHSLYAHFATGTVRVRQGDRVVTGQKLGCIGNSGLSGGPHLHFAMMDGPDVVRARGLPCLFDELWDTLLGLPMRGPLSTHALVRSTAAA